MHNRYCQQSRARTTERTSVFRRTRLPQLYSQMDFATFHFFANLPGRFFVYVVLRLVLAGGGETVARGNRNPAARRLLLNAGKRLCSGRSHARISFVGNVGWARPVLAKPVAFV